MFKSAYLLFLIIFSGLATPFYHSNPYGLVILILIGLLLFSKKLKSLPSSLLVALSIWLVYFIVNLISTKHFNRFFLIQTPIKIIIAWLIVSHWGIKVLWKYEKILFVLSVISLFFFTWQLIHSSSLIKLMSILDVGGRFNSNIIVYTLADITYHTTIPRNPGFTWEPGPFSGFILIAIFINLARSKFNIKRNYSLWVFIITIITTQSSTGMVGVLLLTLWFAYNKYNAKYILIWSPIILGIILYLFFNVPFLKSKIETEFDQDYQMLESRYKNTDTQIALGRFESFKVSLIDFMRYPVAGTGGAGSEIGFVQSLDISFGVINGLGRVLATYGSIGVFFFLMLLYRSGKSFSNYYRFKGAWVFLLLILFIGFGFSIIETPIFFVFYFIHVFSSTRKNGLSIIDNKAALINA